MILLNSNIYNSHTLNNNLLNIHVNRGALIVIVEGFKNHNLLNLNDFGVIISIVLIRFL